MTGSEDSMDLAADKQARRAALRARRETFWSSPVQRASADLALQEQAWKLLADRACRRVFLYLSAGTEARTLELVERCHQRQDVCIPHIVGAGEMTAVRFPGWTDLSTGPFGIQTARSPVICTAAIDAVVVPGLAFTRGGGRLGYGKGFYDRWLAQHPAALRIGLCYAVQIADDLPIAAHDEAVDVLVCESGVAYTGARQSIRTNGHSANNNR